MPKYFTDLKKCWGGGGVCQQIYGLEKCWGGGVMPKYFRDLKKMLGGGYAQIFYRPEKCWGGVPTNFMDLKIVEGGGLGPNIS